MECWGYKKENKKFSFKEVSRNARAREYIASIKWLIDAGLVYKLENSDTPLVPLSAYKNATAFKLYFFDVGLLGALCHLEPKLSLDKEALFRFYKGAVTENYLVQELLANNKKQIAIITKGKPIALLVASKRIRIPQLPIINSTGKLKFSLIFILNKTPPLSTSWS